ncbi:MAG: acetylglutamate kinase [Vicinamibacteria bacterium]|nr:acetylglutamate kinase [Vicinamibacteria bacterium]
MSYIYKIGGPALEDHALFAPLADEIRRCDTDILLVHGGGRRIERMLQRLGIESRFIDGRRETSKEAMEVVEMVLSGLVNKQLVAGLCRFGVPALGVSGRDGNLIRTRIEPGLGRVGTPVSIETALVDALWSRALVPVVSPVSSGPDGDSVNVNADEAALGLARAVSARALVYLSDVDGVRAGDDFLERLTPDDAQRLIEEGTITGGMALKVRVALEAVEAGINEVVIAGKARLLRGFPGTLVCAGAQ